MKHGDFTDLAENYDKYRPGYCLSVLNGIMGIDSRDIKNTDFIDCGAGTGKWTKIVLENKPKSMVAIEPNDEMRQYGVHYTKDYKIQWIKGSGENMEVKSDSCDVLSMASCFHWTDFDLCTKEIHRVLRKGGRFVALWNPRYIKVNPLLVEIENKITELKPKIERKSSGKSNFTNTLADRLADSIYFEDVVYLEGRHTVTQDAKTYIGAWKSVNDVQVQLGPQKWQEFLDYLEDIFKTRDSVEATYLTTAWTAKVKK